MSTIAFFVEQYVAGKGFENTIIEANARDVTKQGRVMGCNLTFGMVE